MRHLNTFADRLRQLSINRTRWLFAVFLGVTLCSQSALGKPYTLNLNRVSTNFCDQTADLLRKACLSETNDEFYVGSATCLNFSDSKQRMQCARSVQKEQIRALEECTSVQRARKSLCRLVGQDRYNPDFSSQNFVDPTQIGSSVEANPYFPLVAGYEWIYRGGVETITITVTQKTKLINGVTCRVVTDVVEVDGKPVEITDDWYGQDLQGNVWYCGENTAEYEVFVGDSPLDPERININGDLICFYSFHGISVLILKRAQDIP